MPAHFIANAGFPATMLRLVSRCIRYSVCKARRLYPGKSRIDVCIAKIVAGGWKLQKALVPDRIPHIQPLLHPIEG